MCTFISAESLAVNALIELGKKKIWRIGFRQLTDFGLSVVEQYKQENNEDAVFVFDPDVIDALAMDYFQFFCIEEEKEQKYICLDPQSDITKLKEQFRWTLSYAMLKALHRVDVGNAIAKV